MTFTHEDALKAAKTIIKHLNGSYKSGDNTLVVTISEDAVKLDFKDEWSKEFKEVPGDVYTVIYPTNILLKPRNPKIKQQEPVVQTQTFLHDMLYKTINASIIKYKVSREHKFNN